MKNQSFTRMYSIKAKNLNDKMFLISQSTNNSKLLFGNSTILHIQEPRNEKILEKKIAEANANKHKSYLFRWNRTDNQLTAYN